MHNAPERARELGCEAMQVFTKNQMQWKGKPLKDDEVEGFREGCRKRGVRAVVSHDSYLINLGNPDESKRKKSLASFVDEIERADRLAIPVLVFHPGSHMGAGEARGIARISDSLKKAIDETPDSRTVLALETTAGQGANLGYRFEQIAEIIRQVGAKKRLGVCLDTAHVFAAGYDLKEDYEGVWRKFARVLGLSKLKAVHLNDSKSALAGRVDRHENIGKGRLGREVFRRLVTDTRFEKTPMILETPNGDTQWGRELRLLHSMAGKNE
jgi:deoxyribonuclease-4